MKVLEKNLGCPNSYPQSVFNKNSTLTAVERVRLFRAILSVWTFDEHIQLPAKLLDSFLRRNRSNINQVFKTVKVSSCCPSRETRGKLHTWFLCRMSNLYWPLSSDHETNIQHCHELWISPSNVSLHSFWRSPDFVHPISCKWKEARLV